MSRPLEVVGGTMWYYMVLQCTTFLSNINSIQFNIKSICFKPPSNDQVNGCKWSICNMFPSSKVAIATALSHHMASEAMKECIEEYLDEYNSVVLSVSSNQLESSYNVLQCLTLSYISRVVGLFAAMRSSHWYVLITFFLSNR